MQGQQSCTQDEKVKVGMFVADVKSLQQPDGSFAGDSWGEIDTRCQKLPHLLTGSTTLHANAFLSFQCHSPLHQGPVTVLQVLLLCPVMLPVAGAPAGD